jgi:hypothetical protein
LSEVLVFKPVNVKYGPQEEYSGVLRWWGDGKYVVISDVTGREKVIHTLRRGAEIDYNDSRSPFGKVARF